MKTALLLCALVVLAALAGADAKHTKTHGRLHAAQHAKALRHGHQASPGGLAGAASAFADNAFQLRKSTMPKKLADTAEETAIKKAQGARNADGDLLVTDGFGNKDLQARAGAAPSGGRGLVGRSQTLATNSAKLALHANTAMQREAIKDKFFTTWKFWTSADPVKAAECLSFGDSGTCCGKKTGEAEGAVCKWCEISWEVGHDKVAAKAAVQGRAAQQATDETTEGGVFGYGATVVPAKPYIPGIAAEDAVEGRNARVETVTEGFCTPQGGMAECSAAGTAASQVIQEMLTHNDVDSMPRQFLATLLKMQQLNGMVDVGGNKLMTTGSKLCMGG